MTSSIAIAHLQQSDPRLKQLIDRIGVIEFTNSPPSDLLTALAQAIISQQISTSVAATIYQRLLQLYQQSDSPLTAQSLLDTPEETLRRIGISRPKIRYLKDLAEKILQGFPTLQELAMMEDEAVIQTLIQIKGVGRWTAQMLLIFYLHRPDVLAADDLGIRNAIVLLYNLNSAPDPKTIEKIAQKWQPYRSIACRYLWRSLTLK